MRPERSRARVLTRLYGALSVYILVALWFEERNLVEAFGDDYRRYQKSVPKLLPIRIRGSRQESSR